MLRFIGNGSAFNTKEGNNSAYMKEGDTLFLIDCGSNIFDRIQQQDLLDGVTHIYVAVTHTHPDHIGSLGDLIFYSYYAMGKIGEISITVLAPPEIQLPELLSRMGVNESCYNFIKVNPVGFVSFGDKKLTLVSVPTKHVPHLPCYGYVINYEGNSIYYSGDANIIPDVIMQRLDEFTHVYQDTCSQDYEGNVHLSLKKLAILVDGSNRGRFYCMHLDKDFNIDEAKQLGFNVVTNEGISS